jgi:hypothetical protein
MSEVTRAHMVTMTSPGLPDQHTIMRESWSGLFQCRIGQVFTPSESHQLAPGVEVWKYMTRRVLRIDIELEALVSKPMFRINPGLYFGLELWSPMVEDHTQGAEDAWAVCRFHSCRLESFEFGVWYLAAVPVEGTHEIYRTRIQRGTDNGYKKEDER